MASGTENNPRSRRDYRPAVERLEAMRLLSSATHTHALADVAVAHHPLDKTLPLGEEGPTRGVSTATWDEALVQTQAELLDSPAIPSQTGSTIGSSAVAGTSQSTASNTDAVALASGLSQLNKYLGRAWFRAGIPIQLHDDSTQAVYATLLQTMGRGQFDALISDVGHSGVKNVFNRETPDGLAFFRTVDMIKKRAQRERNHQSLESVDVSPEDRDNVSSLRAALHEAIQKRLSPREAALIQDTLMGKTPAEIAIQWGVAPKTVSNEKTRVLQKLRTVLADYELN